MMMMMKMYKLITKMIVMMIVDEFDNGDDNGRFADSSKSLKTKKIT